MGVLSIGLLPYFLLQRNNWVSRPFSRYRLCRLASQTRKIRCRGVSSLPVLARRGRGRGKTGLDPRPGQLHQPTHKLEGANGGAGNRWISNCPTIFYPSFHPAAQVQFSSRNKGDGVAGFPNPTHCLGRLLFTSLLLFPVIGLGLITDPLRAGLREPCQLSGSPNLNLPLGRKNSLLLEFSSPTTKPHFSRFWSIPPKWLSKSTMELPLVPLFLQGGRPPFRTRRPRCLWCCSTPPGDKGGARW